MLLFYWCTLYVCIYNGTISSHILVEPSLYDYILHELTIFVFLGIRYVLFVPHT